MPLGGGILKLIHSATVKFVLVVKVTTAGFACVMLVMYCRLGMKFAPRGGPKFEFGALLTIHPLG